MKKAIKIFFALSLLFCSYIFTSMYIMQNNIAPNYKISKGEELHFDSVTPITALYNGDKVSKSRISSSVGESFEVDLKIFGVIPFSTVNVEVVDKMYVSVLGNPFGMKIYTDGVLVIESEDIEQDDKKINPASEAGIKIGDYIKTVDGKKVTCNEDLSELVMESGGKSMVFEVVRDNKSFKCNIVPVLDTKIGIYRIGIWVRDSSAGIGTLTFYSPNNNIICGLGHGICDSDTGTLLSVDEGQMVSAEIVSVEKGTAGSPGALKGKLSYDVIADIDINTKNGVYGTKIQKTATSNLTEIALKQDVCDGKAQILCTVSGDTPRLYDCTVKKINSNYFSTTQNLIVTVTDSELLETTGGIVQGMSGSPLIQNGKLIGAVTHVLVDDPTKGYAIFAENMLETAQSVAEEQKLKEAS